MKRVIVIVIIFRLYDLLLPYMLSKTSLPFNKTVYLSIFHWPSFDVINTESYYKTFDSQHYLYLSEKWYSKYPSQHNAFFPLLPFFIKIFSFFTKSYFWSGMIFVNIISLLGLYLFYIYLDTDEQKKCRFFASINFPIFFLF